MEHDRHARPARAEAPPGLPPELLRASGAGSPRAGRWVASPLALLLPIVSLILGILWLRHWRGGPAGEHARPPAVEGATDVAGWKGSRPGADGVHLTASLAPLHTDEGRQEFDRVALAARLRLPEGQPWRLHLAARRADAGDGGALDLSRVRVVDAEGPAMAVIGATPAPAAAEVADPLAALLAPPVEGLGPGRGVTLILWGRRPGPGARVEGLGDPIPLRVQRLPRSDLVRSLARLDRRAARSAEERE